MQILLVVEKILGLQFLSIYKKNIWQIVFSLTHRLLLYWWWYRQAYILLLMAITVVKYGLPFYQCIFYSSKKRPHILLILLTVVNNSTKIWCKFLCGINNFSSVTCFLYCKAVQCTEIHESCALLVYKPCRNPIFMCLVLCSSTRYINFGFM